MSVHKMLKACNGFHKLVDIISRSEYNGIVIKIMYSYDYL